MPIEGVTMWIYYIAPIAHIAPCQWHWLSFVKSEKGKGAIDEVQNIYVKKYLAFII